MVSATKTKILLAILAALTIIGSVAIYQRRAAEKAAAMHKRLGK